MMKNVSVRLNSIYDWYGDKLLRCVTGTGIIVHFSMYDMMDDEKNIELYVSNGSDSYQLGMDKRKRIRAKRAFRELAEKFNRLLSKEAGVFLEVTNDRFKGSRTSSQRTCGIQETLQGHAGTARPISEAFLRLYGGRGRP